MVIDIAGADPGGTQRMPPPPLKLEKIGFLAYKRGFSHEIPPKKLCLPPFGAIFFKSASAPALYMH